MRIAIAEIAQETNTYSPIRTDMAAMKANGLYRGQEVLKNISERSSLRGFIDVVGTEDLVGIIRAYAMPAGPVTDEALHQIMDWYLDDLKSALPVDGILLSLHGAMVGQSDTDAEGYILEKTRNLVGEEVPVGVAFDLHCNLTRKKVLNATVIRGYHTHPHLDLVETGRAVASMLKRTILGEIKPVICAIKIPMITPAETQLTEEYPMKAIFDLAHSQEKEKGVLSANLFAVQPWMDIPEMGWAVLVVTDDDPECAERKASELANLAWDQRRDYFKPCPTYIEALDEAFAMDEKPIVVSDFADTTNGGGTGDSTWYLKEFLSRNPQELCYLTMVDPQAVEKMEKAGVGARLTLSLGGKQDSIFSEPVEVTGEVTRIIPVKKDRTLPLNMERAGVLQVGTIHIVISERQGSGSDPVVYTGAGLDLSRAKIIVAKSPMDFRAGYKAVGKAFLLGEAPGLSPSNLLTLRWEKVPRPIFPLDDAMTWSCAAGDVYWSK